MIEQLLILLLISVVSFFITYPYFFGYRDRGRLNSIIEKELEINRLENLKQLYIDEIKDIEFDYGMGKLNDEDYSALLDRYKIKAANVLEAIDKSDYKNIKDLSRQIEEEILSYKNSKSKPIL